MIKSSSVKAYQKLEDKVRIKNSDKLKSEIRLSMSKNEPKETETIDILDEYKEKKDGTFYDDQKSENK